MLHPTSGPLAPVSGKKARKLERAANHARQRAIEKALEAEGEVEMTSRFLRVARVLGWADSEVDARTTTKTKEKVQGEKMEIDDVA